MTIVKTNYERGFTAGFCWGLAVAFITMCICYLFMGCTTRPTTPPLQMTKAVAVKRAVPRLDAFGPTPIPATTLRKKAASLASVTLIWDPSPDATVVGYNIYQGGASGAYTNTLDAGANTNLTVGGLVKGRTYYFAATAYTASPNSLESPFSNEVAYSVPAPTPVTNNAVALTAQGSASVNGPWVDLGISWVFPNTAGSQFFRLRIEGTNIPGWTSPSATILTPQ